MGVLDFHTVGPMDGHLSSIILGRCSRVMTSSKDSSSRLRTDARATVSTSVIRDAQVKSNVEDVGREGVEVGGASGDGDGDGDRDGGAGREEAVGCRAFSSSLSSSCCSSFAGAARAGSGLLAVVDDDDAPAALALISASVSFFWPAPLPPPLFLNACALFSALLALRGLGGGGAEDAVPSAEVESFAAPVPFLPPLS